jgi:hypothetical protein
MNASMDALEIRNMSWPSGAMLTKAVPSRGPSIREVHLAYCEQPAGTLELRVLGEWSTSVRSGEDADSFRPVTCAARHESWSGVIVVDDGSVDPVLEGGAEFLGAERLGEVVVHAGSDGGFPVAFLGSSLCYVVAVLLLLDGVAVNYSRARALVEGLLITGGLVFLSWAIVMSTVWRESEGVSVLGRIVLLAYPAIVLGRMARSRAALTMECDAIAP